MAHFFTFLLNSPTVGSIEDIICPQLQLHSNTEVAVQVQIYINGMFAYSGYEPPPPLTNASIGQIINYSSLHVPWLQMELGQATTIRQYTGVLNRVEMVFLGTTYNKTLTPPVTIYDFHRILKSNLHIKNALTRISLTRSPLFNAGNVNYRIKSYFKTYMQSIYRAEFYNSHESIYEARVRPEELEMNPQPLKAQVTLLFERVVRVFYNTDHLYERNGMYSKICHELFYWMAMIAVLRHHTPNHLRQILRDTSRTFLADIMYLTSKVRLYKGPETQWSTQTLTDELAWGEYSFGIRMAWQRGEQGLLLWLACHELNKSGRHRKNDRIGVMYYCGPACGYDPAIIANRPVHSIYARFCNTMGIR